MRQRHRHAAERDRKREKINSITEKEKNLTTTAQQQPKKNMNNETMLSVGVERKWHGETYTDRFEMETHNGKQLKERKRKNEKQPPPFIHNSTPLVLHYSIGSSFNLLQNTSAFRLEMAFARQKSIYIYVCIAYIVWYVRLIFVASGFLQLCMARALTPELPLTLTSTERANDRK